MATVNIFNAEPTHPAAGMPLDRMELINAVASWCECLQGRQPLMTALEQLAKGLGAQAVVLARHTRGSAGRARALAYNEPSDSDAIEKVKRSYAASVLGPYLDRPRPASVWFSSLADEASDPALLVFHRRARLAETVVIALAVEGKWADFLEVHFAGGLPADAAGMLNMLADTLSRTWQRRSPGLFSDAYLASQTEAGHGPREPLLSSSNPARLSRAEFRVCVLLSRGLNTASVCSELSISPSTLKAHLRSIFAKTETSSLAELLFQLLAPRVAEVLPSDAGRARRA